VEHQPPHCSRSGEAQELTPQSMPSPAGGGRHLQYHLGFGAEPARVPTPGPPAFVHERGD
jgi:hypothetical protein